MTGHSSNLEENLLRVSVPSQLAKPWQFQTVNYFVRWLTGALYFLLLKLIILLFSSLSYLHSTPVNSLLMTFDVYTALLPISVLLKT